MPSLSDDHSVLFIYQYGISDTAKGRISKIFSAGVTRGAGAPDGPSRSLLPCCLGTLSVWVTPLAFPLLFAQNPCYRAEKVGSHCEEPDQIGILFGNRHNLNTITDYGNERYRRNCYSATRCSPGAAFFLFAGTTCGKTNGNLGNRDQRDRARDYGLTNNRFGFCYVLDLIQRGADNVR